jgi:hypothetical protein
MVPMCSFCVSPFRVTWDQGSAVVYSVSGLGLEVSCGGLSVFWDLLCLTILLPTKDRRLTCPIYTAC